MTDGGEPALQVDPNEVAGIGQQTVQIAHELSSGARSLDGEVEGLFASWTGDAAEAYRTGWSEVHEGAMKIWDALRDAGTHLGMNADEFRTQDESNAASMNSIRLD